MAVRALDEATETLRGGFYDAVVVDHEALEWAPSPLEIRASFAAELASPPPCVVLTRSGGGGTVPRDDRNALVSAVTAALPAAPVSPSDQIKSLRSVVLSSGGTLPRVRLVVCGAPVRLSTLERAALRIAAFRPPAEPTPAAPVPHLVATMPLGDDLDLELVVLPLVPAFAPLWPLALSGAHAIVRIDGSGSRLLDEATLHLDRRYLDAEDLVPGFAEDDEEKVAELVRAAVERADYR
jgi:hypothetical protein